MSKKGIKCSSLQTHL